MKNRLVVLLAGLFLGALAACGDMSQGEVQGDAQFEPAQLDPQTQQPFCYACPQEPVDGVQTMSTPKPTLDEKSGMYVCPTCPGTVCGDGICSYPETSSSCSYDCGYTPPSPYCGDNSCNNGETCSSCSNDCGVCPPPPGDGYCGDGFCEYPETYSNCRADCRTACLYACPVEP